MVDEVVRDAVFAALPEEDAGAVGVDFADVVDVVVEDEVVVGEVFGAGAVAGDEDASGAEVLEVVVLDAVVLAVEIKADGGAAALGEVAFFDEAVLGATEAEEGVGLVVQFPIVLKAFVLGSDAVGLAVGEAESAEDEIADGDVGGGVDVDLAFDADEFAELGSHDAFGRAVGAGPEVEFFLLGVEDPLAGLVEGVDHVFDPRGFGVRQIVEGIHAVACRDGSGGGLLLGVDRGEREDVEDPGVVRADDEVDVFEIGPVS